MAIFRIFLIVGFSLLFTEIYAQKKTEEEERKEALENFHKMLQDRLQNDWAWFERYKDDNGRLDKTTLGNRVVFMGNSITDGWDDADASFFKENNFINRGIGGQTTPQMLVRFRPDVIDLQPKVVVILAGTNDIAGNTGPSTLEMIQGNIMSMVEIAKANHIKVVLCALLPAVHFPWKPGLQPAEKIVKLNQWIKKYSKENKLVFVDYHTALTDDENGLSKTYSEDGVHPNIKGYDKMKPLVLEGIKKAFRQKKQ